MKNPPGALAEPLPDRLVEDRLGQSTTSCGLPVAAGPPQVCAELDLYDFAVVRQAKYEWSGYRYKNATDAIAEAKRGTRAAGRPR
jgi:hypothetical protein